MNQESKKILLIDDSEDFLMANFDLFNAFGYTVEVANNGADGLKIAEKFKPDVIILDVMMTYDTEGFDVAREIKRRDELKHVKVLLVSGIFADKKLDKLPSPDSQWLPVERILEKPINPAQLINEVEKLFEQLK